MLGIIHHGFFLSGRLSKLTNLNSVSNQQAGPSQVVASIVDEDNGNNSGSGGIALVHDRVLGSDSPANERHHHPESCNQEKRPSSGLVDCERHSACNDQVPDGQDSVDQILGLTRSDTDLGEDIADIVGHKGVARQLGEKTGANANKHSVAITLGRPELGNAALGELGFKGDGLLDLGELVLNKLVVNVSVGVGVGEDNQSLFMTIARDQPSGGFGNGPNACKHDHGRSSLEQAGNSPTPGAFDAESAVGGPGSNNLNVI